MNNEETIIMQPQNGNLVQQVKDVTPKRNQKKSDNGKNVAAMTGAAVFGGAAGGAGTAAAANMYFRNHEVEEEQKVELEQETLTEENVPAPTENPNPKVDVKAEEAEVSVDVNGEMDYTGNAGADPVVEEAGSEYEVQPLSNDNDDIPEVQVLGVYQDEDGMEAAILTNGEEIAAVVDVDGDGYADALLIDENHNEQIEEDEIYDVSEDNMEMAQFEEAYLAQQEQMQQENETFSYNTDDQQDYNNDAPDLSFA